MKNMKCYLLLYLLITLFCLNPVYAFSATGGSVLTQGMMSEANRTYVIEKNYDLNGKTIVVPANCALKFSGGMLGNGTIVGSNTIIKASKNRKVFASDIIIDGTWNVKDIYIDWIEIPNKNCCGPQVKNILRLQNDNVSQIIHFPKYDLAYDPLPNTDSDPRGRTLIDLTSNTKLIIPNKITINTNRLEKYEAIYCYNKKNIEISGGGEIAGDVRTHIYDVQSEYGHGMRCVHCDNVSIKNITFRECIGDGFCTSGTGPAEKEYNFSKGCKNLSLINCTFDANRRQGVSLTCAQDGLLIDGCKFLNTGTISSTLPTAGIDFEPNGDHDTFRNCVVKDCEFSNNVGSQFYSYRANFDGLTVENCKFIAPCEVVDGKMQIWGARSVSLHGTFKNVIFKSCFLNAYLTTDKFRESESLIVFEKCDMKGFYTFNGVYSGPVEKCYTINFNRCNFDIENINYRYAPFFVRNASTDIIFNKCCISNNVDIQTKFDNQFIYRTAYGTQAKFEAYDCTIDLKDKAANFTVMKRCKVRSGNKGDEQK